MLREPASAFGLTHPDRVSNQIRRLDGALEKPHQLRRKIEMIERLFESPKTGNRARPREAHLHFLPPCCPDHNRIERIWKDLHDNVTRNHCCKTMDELMAEVHNSLRHRKKRGKHGYPKRKIA